MTDHEPHERPGEHSDPGTPPPSYRPPSNGGGNGSGNGAHVERLIEEHLRVIPETLGVRVTAALEAVQDRATGGLEGLRSSVAGVEERLASSLVALTEAVRDVPASMRTSLEAAVEGLRTDLEIVRTLPQQVARALHVVRDAVGEIAAAQESVSERLGALSEELGSLKGDVGDTVITVRDEVTGRLAALDEHMTRIERLSGIIESLGKRRGFKDLIATEQRAMEQQAEFVERLTSLGRSLSLHTETLRDRVEDLAARLETLDDPATDREKLAAALDDLRDRVGADLTSGFDHVRAEVAASLAAAREAPPPIVELPETLRAEMLERVQTQVAAATAELKPVGEEAGRAAAREVKELEKATRGMRTELERIRKRLDAWGRARSAPRIAEELTSLEERVVEIERALSEDVAAEVTDRVQRVFERRFEALVQLLDSRMPPQPVAGEEPAKRRGLRRNR